MGSRHVYRRREQDRRDGVQDDDRGGRGARRCLDRAHAASAARAAEPLPPANCLIRAEYRVRCVCARGYPRNAHLAPAAAEVGYLYNKNEEFLSDHTYRKITSLCTHSPRVRNGYWKPIDFLNVYPDHWEPYSKVLYPAKPSQPNRHSDEPPTMYSPISLSLATTSGIAVEPTD